MQGMLVTEKEDPAIVEFTAKVGGNLRLSSQHYIRMTLCYYLRIVQQIVARFRDIEAKTILIVSRFQIIIIYIFMAFLKFVRS